MPCLNGCGMTQNDAAGKSHHVKDTKAFSFDRVLVRKTKKGIHSELHELVAKCIEEYHEPPKIKIGNREVSTFGYYLGKLKRVPASTIYMWMSEIRQSPGIRNPSKIFWWKYKKWRGDK